MILRDVTSKRAVVVGAAALLVAGAVGAVAVASGGIHLPGQDDLAVPVPELSASVTYDEAAETATLTVTGHPIRNDERSTDVSALYVYAERPQDDQPRAPATIRADGMLREDGRWVATSPPRIQSMPLETGTSVTVVGDGVDSDGDGTAGIEPGDTVVVWVGLGPEERMTATVYSWTAG